MQLFFGTFLEVLALKVGERVNKNFMETEHHAFLGRRLRYIVLIAKMIKQGQGPPLFLQNSVNLKSLLMSHATVIEITLTLDIISKTGTTLQVWRENKAVRNQPSLMSLQWECKVKTKIHKKLQIKLIFSLFRTVIVNFTLQNHFYLVFLWLVHQQQRKLNKLREM